MPVAETRDPFAALGGLPERVNTARYLPEMAAKAPDQMAVIAATPSGWERITYGQLERRSNAIARGMAARGVRKGDRASLFVRPGIDLIAVTYALFKVGAVPILADPGMGRKRLVAAMRKIQPRVFVGIPLAHVARLLSPGAFKSVELPITVGRRFAWGGPTLAQLAAADDSTFECADTAATDDAAVLFTSGSTGPPKGVVYTHGMFDAQVRALGALYDFQPGEVDLACFPLFALFNTALEMTSVFPDLDPSRPGTCDPARIVAAIQEHGATSTFGSPAIWRRVVPWCQANGVQLDTLQRVLIAGAPVPPALIEDFRAVLPGGEVHTPYGATESLPVASIAGSEVRELRERVEGGMGTCVGPPAPGIDMRLIAITDEPIENVGDSTELGVRELGEVCVRGPVVTHEYRNEPGHTRAAKMRAEDGGVWHRMGDVGYLDEEGRLWFTGRKAHRLETAKGLRMPVPSENVFNVHPDVQRTALVGVGQRGAESPVLVVEPAPEHMPKTEVEHDHFLSELRNVGRKCHVTADIDTFLFHPGFPVDVRHNAKIDREVLKRWAAEQLA